jgi:hypothetical protein
MNIDKISSAVARVFFAGAAILFVLAVLERVVNWFGYTIFRGYLDAGRLLEWSIMLVIFIIALLLRQIREGLKVGSR